MEIEITSIPPLAPAEESLMDMHSLLNVLNVLQGEIMLMGMYLADDDGLLRSSLRVCERVKASFFDPKKALSFACHVHDEQKVIMEEIDSALRQYPDKAGSESNLSSLENIQSVFHILRVRAEETLLRAKEPDKWLDLSIDALRSDFLAVFKAIEKNSKGRYRIIYNLARQMPKDYYVNFVVESANTSTITMPMLFKDVMRDLIANARKYTAPGGTITVGIHESETELRFVVQDTGCGIPPDELETVVQYGRRGSNVLGHPTMGGGFGLTKAFLVTRRFGGRLWIKSDLGVGTRITIVLPRSRAAVLS